MMLIFEIKYKILHIFMLTYLLFITYIYIFIHINIILEHCF